MASSNILISRQTFDVLLMLDKDALFSAIHTLNFELFGAGDKVIDQCQDNAKIAVFLAKNDTLKNWDAYDAKCKQSAERIKRWREKNKCNALQTLQNVTNDNNAYERDVTKCNNRIEENKNRIEENRVNSISVVLDSNSIVLDNNINNKEKENIIKEKEKRHVFQKPTIPEIESYINENKYSVNAAKFFDFYESKGWYVGKNKMKDWRAAVRTWQRDTNSNGNDKKRAARVDNDFNSTF